MRKHILLVVVLTALVTASFAQNTERSFIKDSLDNYIIKALHDWNIPGVAVCIVKDSQVVLLKGYGVKQMNTNDSVDENTLFMIGSNTKAFTATLLATLDQEKKLSLDDKVTKWLPEFKLDNKLAGEQAIIRDLLCHRLGFQTFQGDFTYWKSNLTREEVIEKMSHIKAVYPFRTTWGYTNAAFLTAGQIIPKVTGMQWEDYLKQKIFDPLGMTRTIALSNNLPSATNKAVPHTIVDGKLITEPFPQIDNLAPAGAISTSVNDISKWVMMLLNKGTYMNKEIIPAKAIEAIMTPNSIIGNGGTFFNEGHFSLYGLGLELSEYEGRKIVAHTGGVTGFVSSVTLIPEEKLGIVVFTNTDQNYFFEALKNEIMDAYLKLPFRNYSDVYLNYYKMNQGAQDNADKKLKDSAALNLKTALPLQNYTGKYFNDVYGNMEVVLDSGKLKMKFSHHPDMYASLQSLGGDRFYAVFTDPDFSKAVFPFHVENGKVKSVTVKVADFVEYNPYEFTKQE